LEYKQWSLFFERSIGDNRLSRGTHQTRLGSRRGVSRGALALDRGPIASSYETHNWNRVSFRLDFLNTRVGQPLRPRPGGALESSDLSVMVPSCAVRAPRIKPIFPRKIPGEAAAWQSGLARVALLASVGTHRVSIPAFHWRNGSTPQIRRNVALPSSALQALDH